MNVHLHPEEPQVDEWRVASLEDFARLVVGRLAATPVTSVVAVDGRSGSGKTTLADALQSSLHGAVTVHTDDVAWHHSFFDWSDLLINGVLQPMRRQQLVSYRPPAWDERGREGAISVPTGTAFVIVEGVGAGRRDLTPWIDLLIWVQSDFIEAERRGVLRDGGDEQAASFWQEWIEQENPFQATELPWTRADLIVNGTPRVALRPGLLQYAEAPPLTPQVDDAPHG